MVQKLLFAKMSDSHLPRENVKMIDAPNALPAHADIVCATDLNKANDVTKWGQTKLQGPQENALYLGDELLDVKWRMM